MNYVAKIDGVRIWNKVEEIEKVLQDLETHKDLIKSIELSSNSIGFEAAQALSQRIAQLTGLEIANYRDLSCMHNHHRMYTLFI